MKKFTILIVSITLIVFLASCDFSNSLSALLSDMENKPTYTTTKYQPITNSDGSEVLMFKPTNLSKYEDFYPVNGIMPSTGDVKVLVIPVDFIDYSFDSQSIIDLNKAFFNNGSNYSLSSFYKESSYNNLNITGEVLECYHSPKKTTNITDQSDVERLVLDALDNYDDIINYKNYDANNDGYIDAIYLIYPKKYDTSSDVWWAYQDYTLSNLKFDGIKSNGFVWASSHFMYDQSLFANSINAYTFIHETGHLMGADDYYDYNESVGTKWGVGGFDLMDETEGDHNPFTKMLYGWTTPTVITGGSHTVYLNKFSKNGDMLIINPNYNGDILDEYFIVDYYNGSDGGILKNDYINTSGIRIYHVNATYTGKNSFIGTYPNVFDYDNSDTTYGMLQLIEYKKPSEFFTKSIMNGGSAHNNCIFPKGSTFNPTNISTDQFIDKNIDFTIKVIDLGDTATIEVIFN